MNATPPRVQLVGRDNGAGLSRDMALVADVLAGLGVPVDVVALPRRGRLAAWLTARRLAFGPPRYALQILFERIRPEFAAAAHRHVLVPNPEWFETTAQPLLRGIDEVWTKTTHARKAFEALDVRTRAIGFASVDRHDPQVPREPVFFHGPGRSSHKGTAALLALWASHPHWPRLTVVWRRKRVELGETPANVWLIRDHLDDAAYRALQNSHRFHLCPSQTEGYGHYLVEAMSCAAVVVTLDAAPMNELVGSDRGLLVPARPCDAQGLATLHTFEPAAMAVAIEQCIAMTEARAAELGAGARRWYLQQHGRLADRLRDALVANGIDVPLATGAG